MSKKCLQIENNYPHQSKSMCDHMVDELKFAIKCGVSSKKLIPTTKCPEFSRSHGPSAPRSVARLLEQSGLSVEDVQHLIEMRNKSNATSQQAHSIEQSREQQRHKLNTDDIKARDLANTWIYAENRSHANGPLESAKATKRARQFHCDKAQQRLGESENKAATSKQRHIKALKPPQLSTSALFSLKPAGSFKHGRENALSVQDDSSKETTAKWSLEKQKIPIAIELEGARAAAAASSSANSQLTEQQIDFETYVSKSNIVNFV